MTGRFIELLNKKKAGDINLHELHELNRLLDKNPDLSAINDSFNDFFEQPLLSDVVSEAEARESFEKLRARITPPMTKRSVVKIKWLRPLSIAACLILLAGIGIFLMRNNDSSAGKKTENAVVTNKGSKSDIILPDGTKVWLNGDSKISYSQNYGAKTRDVFLQGEAFFQVVKDSSNPFIVHTESMNIKVLGTVFNVKAYASDATTQATLISGAIEVDLKQRSGKKIFLNPGEKISIKNAKAVSSVQKKEPEIELTSVNNLSDSMPAETLWVKNKIAFDQETFREIALELERWYGVQIVIHSEKLKNKTFSGVFENKSIDEVMDALQLVGKFQYTNKNNTVTIY